ncbi:MAG: hypothetical protein ABI887_06035 [Burkholderiales bacterium]
MKDTIMSSLKTLRPSAFEAPRPAHEAARRVVAAGLRSASAALARLSRRLAPSASRVARPVPRLEFYAEAGAPEGALYLDGQFVGWVPGVQRL